MNIKIELNDDSSSEESNLAKAVSKRKEAGVGETLDEAFFRILSMKNSDPDKRRIQSVWKAMEDGWVGRESIAVEKGKKLTKAEVLRLHKQVVEVEQERILQQMKDNMPDNYVLVNEIEQLRTMIRNVCKNDIIPIDVETTGTDIWSDYIVGYVISDVLEDVHYYVPTKHKTEETQLDHDFVTVSLRQVFEKPDATFVLHNGKFDIHMLLNEGVTVSGALWDTQECMRLLNENEDSYALKKLASKYLNTPSKTYGELFGKKGFHEVSDLLIATSYAAKDGEITEMLREFQVKHLSEQFPSIYEYIVDVEMPLIYTIIEMERNGFVIDTERAEEYGKELSSEQESVRERISTVLGDINLNSPVQLKEALEAHTGRTLKDTDAKRTLKPLAKEFAIVADILRYKEISKLLGTYVEKMPKAINERTGKLMGAYNQNGAKTGRFSSGGDAGNMQNQPPEARQLFVASPGKIIVGADFKAQEIRAVAYLSQEPVLIQAFQEERDPYAMMASNFYKKPYEDVYKNADGSDTKERKEMKVVWLATLYGMSNISLAEMLGVPKKEADRLQTDLFNSMPKLQKWIDDTKAFVQRHGYVWMDGKKRKRRLPEAKQQKYEIPYGKYYDDKYEKHRLHNSAISRSLRQAPNAVVQGSSGIQTKVTLIAMDELCRSKDGWSLYSTIHDEILVEIPEDATREDFADIERVMIETYPWGETVANGTDLEVQKRWGEGMTVEDWFKSKEDE